MGSINLTIFAIIICFVAAARGVNQDVDNVGQKEVENDHIETLNFRYKRDSYYHRHSLEIPQEGLPVFVIAIIVVATLILPIICCCCCCCACCPCYHWCHPNNTNVTIIQPSSSLPGPTVMQNYFNHGPSESAASSQDPPPQYSQKGYGRLSTPAAECV